MTAKMKTATRTKIETRATTMTDRARKQHAAAGARLLAGGLAAGAGLAMVGAMVGAAQTDLSQVEAQQTTRRIVVVDQANEPVFVIMQPASRAPQVVTRVVTRQEPQQRGQVSGDPTPVARPAPPQPAPVQPAPVTESGGS